MQIPPLVSGLSLTWRQFCWPLLRLLSNLTLWE